MRSGRLTPAEAAAPPCLRCSFAADRMGRPCRACCAALPGASSRALGPRSLRSRCSKPLPRDLCPAIGARQGPTSASIPSTPRRAMQRATNQLPWELGVRVVDALCADCSFIYPRADVLAHVAAFAEYTGHPALVARAEGQLAASRVAASDARVIHHVMGRDAYLDVLGLDAASPSHGAAATSSAATSSAQAQQSAPPADKAAARAAARRKHGTR